MNVHLFLKFETCKGKLFNKPGKMKILHTADWHIGQTFFGYERTDEHEAFLDWLITQITEQEIDVLLIAGDIFDVANPSAQAQKQFYRFIKTATDRNPRLQIVIIAGNHDSAARLETPIPLLEEMNTYIKGVIKRDQSGQIDTDDLIIGLKDRNGIRQAWCMAIPYLRQGDYPPVETTGNAYAAGVKNMYETVYQKVLERKTANEAIIAMGHLQAANCCLSDDDDCERLLIGGLEGVSADTFNSGITYTALGHIHREQCVGKQSTIRYAGSPLPMSFAEENYKHGVILIEIENGQITRQEKLIYSPLVNLLRIPKHPKPLSEVLEELTLLPESHTASPAPYAEVLVMLTEPEPSLRHHIEEAVEKKHIRLTRVIPHYPGEDSMPGENETLTTGQLMNPWDMVQLVYQEKYKTEIPKKLEGLFMEAMQESYQKMGGKS